jgi:ACS family tartrate transporter-like MFS transporter
MGTPSSPRERTGISAATSGRAAEPALEHRAFARARRRLIPFLFLLYVVAYLDRVNVGFAALQMNAALGLTPAVFGLGAGIFFLGYTLFEIPSNLLMQRFGARVWIARIMISWGLVSAGMMFVQGPASFYLLRLLLGIGEAGFFPGVILYLTCWFPAAERARAVASFMTATAIAGVVGGPISGALLLLDGVGGLGGWQWLFLLEGLPAVALGLVVLKVLPNGPADASWLPAEERQAILARLAEEHGAAGTTHDLRSALTSGRVWLLGAVYFCVVCGLYGISFWLPQILRSLAGWGDLRIGLMSALPYLVAAVTMVVAAAHSDRTGERRRHVALSLVAGAVGFVVASSQATLTAFAGLALAAIGVWGSFGPFWALPTRFLRGTAAAAGIALVNSLGNVGGFVGPYMVGLVKDATGRFEAGLLSLAALLVVGAVLAWLVPHRPTT